MSIFFSFHTWIIQNCKAKENMLNFHLNTEELSRSFQNVRAHVKSNSSGRLGGDMIVSLSHSFSAVFILYRGKRPQSWNHSRVKKEMVPWWDFFNMLCGLYSLMLYSEGGWYPHKFLILPERGDHSKIGRWDIPITSSSSSFSLHKDWRNFIFYMYIFY